MNDVIEFLKSTRLWSEEEAEKTFKRWYQWMIDVCTHKDIGRHFGAITKSDYDQLITVKDIDVVLVCPHHLLPVVMNVHIAYMPDGKILGLSKFARIAKDLSVPIIQEEYTQTLVDIIKDKLNPKWIMAIVVGEHSCMQCRGVRAINSKTITSAVKSRVDDKASKSYKDEFMRIVKFNGG